MVPRFKYSFLYLNPTFCGSHHHFCCLAVVFCFWTQIHLLCKWYSNLLKWEHQKDVFISCFLFSTLLFNIIIVFFIFRFIKHFALSLSLFVSPDYRRQSNHLPESQMKQPRAPMPTKRRCAAWHREVSDPPSWVFAFFFSRFLRSGFWFWVCELAGDG